VRYGTIKAASAALRAQIFCAQPLVRKLPPPITGVREFVLFEMPAIGILVRQLSRQIEQESRKRA